MGRVYAGCILVFWAAGCRQSVRTVTVSTPGFSGRWAVFAPDYNGYSDYDNWRSVWPASEAFDGGISEVSFAEVNVDIQNRYPTRFEGPYRRHYSVRRGYQLRP